MNRIKLNTFQYMGHFSVLMIPLVFPVIELILKLNGKEAVNSFPLGIHLLIFCVCLILAYFKWKELKFRNFTLDRTDNEFKQSVIATANKLHWDIDKLASNYSEATSYNKQKSKDLQKITIIRKGDKISINSIIEPIFIPFPDFFGANRTNRSTFIKYLELSNTVEDINETVIQKIKDERIRLENEPEWNLKNTLWRLMVYLFSIGFLALAYVLYKFDGFSFLVPIFIVLGSFYFVLDFYVLIKKRSKPDHNKT